MYGADSWNTQVLNSQQPTVDNISLATRVLLEQVCTNKESLVMVFQELFGPQDQGNRPQFGTEATRGPINNMLGVQAASTNQTGHMRHNSDFESQNTLLGRHSSSRLQNVSSTNVIRNTDLNSNNGQVSGMDQAVSIAQLTQ
jgi:hypothetical protein